MKTLKLFADYHQIHVVDEDYESELDDAWDDDATRDRFALAEDVVAVVTEDNRHVLVEVDVLDAAPEDDSAAHDHVTEVSLSIPSGRLAVLGCSDFLPDAAHFDVPAGTVRVRSSHSNIAAVIPAGLEEGSDEATMERVRLQIWPAPPAGSRVVKRWDAPRK